MAIEIKNLRKVKPSQPWDVKIDRSSPLGNDFYMDDESQRDKVCDEYDAWLELRINECNTQVCDELNRLIEIYRKYEQLNLFCWCAPKRCHGESIRKAIASMYDAYK